MENNTKKIRLDVRKPKQRRVTYKDIVVIQSIVIASFITDKLILHNFFNYHGAIQRLFTVFGSLLFFSVLIFKFSQALLRPEER